MKNYNLKLIISLLLLLIGVGSYAWLNFFLLEKYIYNLHFQNPLEPTIFVIGRSAKLKLIAIGLISFLLSFFSLKQNKKVALLFMLLSLIFILSVFVPVWIFFVS